MKVKFRKRNNNNLRKIVQLEEGYDNQNRKVTIVELKEVEGNVAEVGDALTEETFEKINAHDDNEVVFSNQTNNELPEANIGKTKIVGLANGETWVIPARGLKNKFKVSEYTDPLVNEVVTKFDVNGTSYDNGLAINSGVLDTKPGREAEYNEFAQKYVGNRGVVSVIAENGLQIKEGNIKVAVCENVTTDSDKKHGTVQVIQGNGLKLSNGTIKMNTADDLNAGAIKVTSGNGLNCLSGNLSLGLANSSTNGAMSKETYNEITQLKSQINSLNSNSSASNGDLLYQRVIVLYGQNISLGSDLYASGYKKLKIEVYKETDDGEDRPTYCYENYGEKTIVVPQDQSSTSSYNNYFSIITTMGLTSRAYIEGRLNNSNLIMSAYSNVPYTGYSSQLSYADGETYNVKVYGYK